MRFVVGRSHKSRNEGRHSQIKIGKIFAVQKVLNHKRSMLRLCANLALWAEWVVCILVGAAVIKV